MVREGELFKIDQQVSLRCCICHDFPDRSFHKQGRKLMGESACHLCDLGHFSKGPHARKSFSNFSKGKYLVFDVTGQLLITVTNGGYPNAVISGVFTN